MVIQKTDFYQDLRLKFRDWLNSKAGKNHKYAEYLMWTPDLFHLLIKLSLDKEVPVEGKAKLAGAIAYFISPIDLVPEAVAGPIGYVDDIALAAYVLNSIINNANPEVVKKHWAGDGNVLDIIQQIIKIADEMLGSGLWKKLKGLTD